MMHWQGLTELTGASYTPLGLVNADPAGLQVRADAPYKTVKDLVDAIKAEPGKFKASGTGQGGIWHLALAGMLKDLKARPGRRAVGALERRRARPAGPGRRRRRHRALLDPRGALADRRRQGEEPGDHGRQARRRSTRTCRRCKAQTGSDWTMAAWRGIAAPKGLPTDVRDDAGRRRSRRSTTARSYKDFMASRGFGVTYLPPAEFATLHGEVDRRPRRDDEGGRHRQVAGSSRAAEAQRRRLAARCCSPSRARYSGTSRAFRSIPGQKHRPRVRFPGPARRRPAPCCAHRPDRARRARQRHAAGWCSATGCARRATLATSLLTASAVLAVLHRSPPRRLGFPASPASLILLALFLKLGGAAWPSRCRWRCVARVRDPRMRSTSCCACRCPGACCAVLYWTGDGVDVCLQALRAGLRPLRAAGHLLPRRSTACSSAASRASPPPWPTALLVPITFFMPPVPARRGDRHRHGDGDLLRRHPGALLRIPGTPASAAYTDEAYAMTLQGPGRDGARRRPRGSRRSAALFGTAGADLRWRRRSAEVALKFSSFEYFWLVLLGLAGAVFIGLGVRPEGAGLAAPRPAASPAIGLENPAGYPRFTFGIDRAAGRRRTLIPMMVGMFAVSEILRYVVDTRAAAAASRDEDRQRVQRHVGLLTQVSAASLLRGSALGTAIGIQPGAGRRHGGLDVVRDERSGSRRSRRSSAPATSRASSRRARPTTARSPAPGFRRWCSAFPATRSPPSSSACSTSRD